jgi:hypothetical protein
MLEEGPEDRDEGVAVAGIEFGERGLDQSAHLSSS